MPVSHVRKLENSPAFQELLASYLQDRREQFRNLAAQFEGLTEDLLEVAHELVEAHQGGQRLTFGEVIRALTRIAPIAGYAPVQKVEQRNLTYHLTPADLEVMKEEFRRRQGAEVYDVRAIRGPDATQASLAETVRADLSPAQERAALDRWCAQPDEAAR